MSASAATAFNDTDFELTRELMDYAAKIEAHARTEWGIEPRSDCELITVLAFHHEGLFDDLDAAEKVISANAAEDFISAGSRHLPFVPFRMQPRNVVLQDRIKLVPGKRDEQGLQAPLL